MSEQIETAAELSEHFTLPWRELPFEVHSRPAPCRVWTDSEYFIEYVPLSRNAFVLARSLDPFGACLMFDTFEAAAEAAASGAWVEAPGAKEARPAVMESALDDAQESES